MAGCSPPGPMAFTASVREALARDRKVVDPRRYLAPARDAMAATVAHLLRVLAERAP